MCFQISNQYAELFALPGSGKSFIAKQMDYSDVVKQRSVISISKNIIIATPNIISIMRIIFIYLLYSHKKRQFLKLCLVLLERIGQAKCGKNTVDEGVLQCIWGLSFRIKENNIAQKLIVDCVETILPNNLLYFYVSTNKRVQLRQYVNRTRENGIDFFDFNDPGVWQAGRDRVSFILKTCRRSQLALHIIKNRRNLL